MSDLMVIADNGLLTSHEFPCAQCTEPTSRFDVFFEQHLHGNCVTRAQRDMAYYISSPRPSTFPAVLTQLTADYDDLTGRLLRDD